MKKRTYEMITGFELDLTDLPLEERAFLAAVERRYAKAPEWSAFSAWWTQELRRSHLPMESVAYRVCQDLEARLGIAQGKVALPDYRDYLMDLIEERYGSRYQFCKATGIDPGHLSRVFASRSDLSLQSLPRILDALDVALVIQPKEDISRRVSPERAVAALAVIAEARNAGRSAPKRERGGLRRRESPPGKRSIA